MGDQITDSYSIFAGWKNHFSQPFSVHGVCEVQQTEIETAEPLVPEPSAFEDEMAIEELREMVPPPSQNTVGVCNQIILLSPYYISS